MGIAGLKKPVIAVLVSAAFASLYAQEEDSTDALRQVVLSLNPGVLSQYLGSSLYF